MNVVHATEEENVYMVCASIFKTFIFQREGTKKANSYVVIGHLIKPKRGTEVQRFFEHNLEMKNILVHAMSKPTHLINDFYRSDTKRLSGPFCAYRLINELVKLSVHIAKWAIDNEIYESQQFLRIKEREMNFPERSLKRSFNIQGLDLRSTKWDTITWDNRKQNMLNAHLFFQMSPQTLLGRVKKNIKFRIVPPYRKH